MAACLLFAVLLSVSWLPGRALDPGINTTHIVVGQTAPFSGLQADYGTRLAAGIRVAFEEANAAGGVRLRWPSTQTGDLQILLTASHIHYIHMYVFQNHLCIF